VTPERRSLLQYVADGDFRKEGLAKPREKVKEERSKPEGTTAGWTFRLSSLAFYL
jgi:hypothetical protein